MLCLVFARIYLLNFVTFHIGNFPYKTMGLKESNNLSNVIGTKWQNQDFSETIVHDFSGTLGCSEQWL